MDNHISIIIDTAFLSVVCGANDTNLKTIEDVLGGRIAVRGNEVMFYPPENAPAVEGQAFAPAAGFTRQAPAVAPQAAGSAAQAARFTAVMESLTQAAKAGEQPDAAYVRAALAFETDAGGKKNPPNGIRNSLITVPHGFAKVYPRGPNQAEYIQGMREKDITFCVGPAGTGKTYLAIAMALSLVISKKMRKLVLTRPVVEAGESLGYLPGDLAQKISPYLRPLYDAMEDIVPFEYISRMEENHVIEIAPLAYMRGRSLNDAFIILDEAQNTTKEQMKMFLTRLGKNSRAVITGDATQIDLPGRAASGLIHALSILKGIDGIHFSYLNTGDVVRHPLLKKIIAAYEERETLK